jgi:hypothetical protein
LQHEPATRDTQAPLDAVPPAKVEAPFTADQVASLNAAQRSGALHPFTCANRSDGNHQHHGDDDLGQLVATPDGWRCEDCDYTQAWAWRWMADGSWATWTSTSAPAGS